jgi:broad specificity phosphatase PhoE
VRHGETVLNKSNCWRGWQNPVLNEAGEAAAEAIQNFFSYEEIGKVVSSDLTRAMQTAQYVLDTGNVVIPYVSPDPNLRSWAIGGFAGMEKTKANIAKFEYYVNHDTEVIPETNYGLPGESLQQFRERNNCILDYVLNPVQGLPTVIVVHTSNITAFHRMVHELEDNNEEVADIIEPGGIIGVYVDTDGNIDIKALMGETNSETTPEAS